MVLEIELSKFMAVALTTRGQQRQIRQRITRSNSAVRIGGLDNYSSNAFNRLKKSVGTEMTYKSDIEIARAARKQPIAQIGEKLGIPSDHLLPFGHDKAKVLKSLSNPKLIKRMAS